MAQEGVDGFYRGSVAEKIVETLHKLGGVMTLADLIECKAEIAEPISTTYRGKKVHQVPLPTHGVTVLLALNILEQFAENVCDLGSHSSASHLHVLVDAMRIAYSDAAAHVADPQHSQDRTTELLSKEYARKRANDLMSHEKCVTNPLSGLLPGGTVQFCTMDKEGNAVSMVQSNYVGFGTGHGKLFFAQYSPVDDLAAITWIASKEIM